MRFILSLCIFTIFLSSCSFWEFPKHTISENQNQTWAYQTTLDPDIRLDLAKKRKSYIAWIRKGDFYSLQNAPEEALSYYLSIQEKIPDDQVVRKKIAHVYFLLKNWSKAYSEYVQVPLSELSSSEQDELYHALFFDGNRYDRLGELAKLPSTNLTPYYDVVDACYTGIHNCIVSIQSSSGSNSEILDLKNQIENATKISDDFQYRNLLVAAKFYEQWMYRASTKIAQEILQNRPDYTEVIKIEWFSLYELGEYTESKKLILQYLEKNPNDLQSIMRMGEIAAHLSDYSSSNLYLNNAIISGYQPKIDLERRLVYNYSLLGDTAWAMKVFAYLLQDEAITPDDFAVGISFALEQGENEKAESWAIQWLRKFRDSPIIQPLYIQILRLTGDRDDAMAIIQNTSEEIQNQNPNYQLEKAILLLDSWDVTTAKTLFQKLAWLSEWPDIVKESDSYLSQISSMKSASGSTNPKNTWW